MKKFKIPMRFILNIAATLLLVAILFLAFKFYNPSGIATIGDSPPLTTLELLDVQVKDSPATIVTISANLPAKGPTSQAVAADILSSYNWSRQYFRPYKCGPEYPASLCRIGVTQIIIFSTQEGACWNPPNVKPCQVQIASVIFWLDQTYVERLPFGEPLTIEELIYFHQQVAQETIDPRSGKPTGGNFAQLESDPRLFVLSK